jgi:hypothetical protein
MAFRRLAFSCHSCCSMATTPCIWMLEASPILVVYSRQTVILSLSIIDSSFEASSAIPSFV